MVSTDAHVMEMTFYGIARNRLCACTPAPATGTGSAPPTRRAGSTARSVRVATLSSSMCSSSSTRSAPAVPRLPGARVGGWWLGISARAPPARLLLPAPRPFAPTGPIFCGSSLTEMPKSVSGSRNFSKIIICGILPRHRAGLVCSDAPCSFDLNERRSGLKKFDVKFQGARKKTCMEHITKFYQLLRPTYLPPRAPRKQHPKAPGWPGR